MIEKVDGEIAADATVTEPILLEIVRVELQRFSPFASAECLRPYRVEWHRADQDGKAEAEASADCYRQLVGRKQNPSGGTTDVLGCCSRSIWSTAYFGKYSRNSSRLKRNR